MFGISDKIKKLFGQTEEVELENPFRRNRDNSQEGFSNRDLADFGPFTDKKLPIYEPDKNMPKGGSQPGSYQEGKAGRDVGSMAAREADNPNSPRS